MSTRSMLITALTIVNIYFFIRAIQYFSNPPVSNIEGYLTVVKVEESDGGWIYTISGEGDKTRFRIKSGTPRYKLHDYLWLCND